MFTDAIGIGILVAALHSPSFQCRQAATAGLECYGERAEAQLVVACQSSDPEVRRRAEYLVARLLPGKIDRMFARNHADGGVPWCDAIAWPHPKWRALYCEYASDSRVAAQAKLEEQRHFPAYRAITRLFVVDEIYGGRMTLDEAEALLAAMCRRHVLWQAGKWMDEASEE